MSAFLVVNCPNCGSLQPHHIDESTANTPQPQYWCQGCETYRTLKPSQLIDQGMRRAQPIPPGNIQSQIDKQLKQQS